MVLLVKNVFSLNALSSLLGMEHCTRRTVTVSNGKDPEAYKAEALELPVSIQLHVKQCHNELF